MYESCCKNLHSTNSLDFSLEDERKAIQTTFTCFLSTLVILHAFDIICFPCLFPCWVYRIHAFLKGGLGFGDAIAECSR